MSNVEVTNGDLMNMLGDIREKIGGLKSSNDLFLKGLENHGERISVLEGAANRQKGEVKVWGLVATSVAGLVGAVPAIIKLFRH